MGVKHTVLPDGQPRAIAFTLLAQLRGPKANETEMGATRFTKNGEGRTLTVIRPWKLHFQWIVNMKISPTRAYLMVNLGNSVHVYYEACMNGTSLHWSSSLPTLVRI